MPDEKEQMIKDKDSVKEGGGEDLNKVPSDRLGG